jgi:hypothetical protein
MDFVVFMEDRPGVDGLPLASAPLFKTDLESTLGAGSGGVIRQPVH